jgi:hypothetical protein
MFFEISEKEQKNFTKNYHLKNGIFLNLDSGWNVFNIGGKKLYFKGYISEKQPFETIINDIIKDPTPRFKGNFFLIICSNKKITLTNDKNRGTPVYYCKDSKVITNLSIKEGIWANSFCELDYDFNITIKKFNPYNIIDKKLSYEQGIEKIYNIIANEFDILLTKNKSPIKIFLSGGIDTLTLYSFLKKFTKNFELVDYEYKKWTHFYKHNRHDYIKKYWAYNQIHTWGEEPTILITGACGDEYMLRGPATIKYLIDYYNIDFISLLKKNKDCYHYDYFMREKNIDIFKQEKKVFAHKEEMILYILNILINDHQHWHLDKTICFTPFKNIELPNIVMNLEKDILIEQMLDAKINKDLILKNNPDDLQLLSKYKNKF